MFFVFDNQGGASFAEEFDDFEPVVEIGVVLAGVGNEEIERSFGEKELELCAIERERYYMYPFRPGFMGGI